LVKRRHALREDLLKEVANLDEIAYSTDLDEEDGHFVPPRGPNYPPGQLGGGILEATQSQRGWMYFLFSCIRQWVAEEMHDPAGGDGHRGGFGTTCIGGAYLRVLPRAQGLSGGKYVFFIGT
jgi:hypothetical protein